MATNVQKNVLDELQSIAQMLIAIKSRGRTVVEMYGNEVIAQLTDADIQELASFAGVTVAELTGAVYVIAVSCAVSAAPRATVVPP